MKRITQGLMVIVSAVVMTFWASAVMADDVKIGVVDLREVMQESSQAKVIGQNLEKQFKPRQAKLFSLEKQLKADVEKMRRDATIMTAAQKKQLQSKVMSEQQKLEQSGNQYQKDLNAAQNKAMQEFLADVKVALDKVAKEYGYNLILQKESVPYSADSMDVTKQLIAALA